MAISLGILTQHFQTNPSHGGFLSHGGTPSHHHSSSMFCSEFSTIFTFIDKIYKPKQTDETMMKH